MSVSIERVSWAGWPNSYRVTNGEAELILTSDVGPRVIRYGFVGGQNLFLELPDQLGGSAEHEFMPRGGHRLWSAPEDLTRTYAADNFPVHISIQGPSIEATAPVEPGSELRKQIRVRIAGVGSGVTVMHRIENTLAWPIDVSAWALTMMAPGGLGITGFPPRGTHPECLAPTHPLVMWAFSDLSDPRWTFTRKYMLLRQDVTRPEPTKLGLFNEQTWGAYLLNNELFLKRYDADRSKEYPDFGCSYETFANGTTLELETLGPLTRLGPGEKLEHTERWTLHRNVILSDLDDSSLDDVLLPIL